MNPASHGSSSSTCVLSGSQHPPSFSLTTDAFASEAMYAYPPQIPAPRSLDGQHRPSYISAPAVQSQSPSHWPPSPFPPSFVAPHSRPVTGHGSDNDSAFSPSSQPSRYSAPIHSPGTTFSDRRMSYDPSPFQASFSELNEPMAQAGRRASSPASETLLDAATPSTAPVTESPAVVYAAPSAPNSVSASFETAKRCHLHIRQQPRAARAGPDGKDRRAVDPPPVVQLLMDDFDPDNEADVAELKCPFWVVHCRLVGAVAVNSDVSTQSYYTDDGQKEVQRLLLGTTVASPTHTSDDPDPPTMPTHPRTRDPVSAPPSPTSRFLPSAAHGRLPRAPQNIPGSFFIFADLSVRRAGEYRLQFTLMKMEPPLLRVGATVPAHHVVTSQVFRAVNAKDFDQVQPSTNLVKGLLDRGAGFPLKLKKGIREGQRRRRHNWDDYSDDEDSGDYDNE